MLIKLPYGVDKVALKIPDKNFIEMLDPPLIKPNINLNSKIESSINSPIGGTRLENIISPGKSVSIIIDDCSRPTPISDILPILIKKLLAIGVSQKDIVIVAALGSHRYMTEKELEKRVGKEIYNHYRVVNSEFKKPEGLVYVGKTPEGVDIQASKVVMETDIHIGIGCLVPHPVMGWGGGGKIIYPGIASEKTVSYFHLKASLFDTNLFGLETTPIRDMMENWVDSIGLHFIINVILNAKSQVVDVVAGHYIKAHREGVRRGKKIIGYKVKEKADIIIAGSHPADQDFWQSPKALYAAEAAVKGEHGGIMILLSPNYEGIGPHPDYPKWMGRDDGDECVKRCLNGENLGDPLAIAVGNSMSKLRRRRRLIVVSDGVTDNDMSKCGCEHFPLFKFQSMLDTLIYDNPNCRIGVLSNGAETFLYE